MQVNPLFLAMKTALITGASKGIGRALALRLANECTGLVLCARRSAPLLRLKTELEQLNPDLKVLTSETDCSDPVQLAAFIDFTDQNCKRIDYLINNLGTYIPGDIFSEEEDTLKSQLEINLYPAYTLCAHYGRQMKQYRSGCIINIGSSASFEPVADAAAYTVTKFAMRGLTDVMQASLLGSGVQVIGVYPGSTKTSSWDNETVPADMPILEPEEVAEAVFTAIKSGQTEVHIQPTKK